MSRHRKPGFVLRLIVLAALLALIATACTSDDDGATDDGVTQADVDAVAAQLEEAQAELAAMQDQMVSEPVNQVVTQAGELAAAPAPAPLPDDGWTNEESIRGGLFLVAQLDSSGPDAWDIEAHPRVYFTSESFQSNFYNENDIPADLGNFAGWHVVDAYSKEVIAAGLYQDIVEGEVNRGPHGVSVSPDGKWGYVGFATAPAEGCEGEFGACDRIGYVMVVNTRTMKVDKVLRQESYFEGGFRSQAVHHIQCWTQDSTGEDYCIIQWGFGANGGPHHIIKPNDNNRVYRSITYDDIKPMGHPFTTPTPDGEYIFISMGANWIRSQHGTPAAVAKYEVATGKHEVIQGTGTHPIGITHTQDGRFTYVIDGHGSWIYKIDNETNEIVDDAAAGIAGPYGICLTWDETEAWINGKGEGTANLGNSMSIFDLGPDAGGGRFRASRTHGNTPFYLGGSASSVEHCTLHPDPDVNEIWISNMKGWETIVVDLSKDEVAAYIATPNNGDTHGMAFVWYNDPTGPADAPGSWDTGMLMGDMGGPKAQVFQDMVAANAAAAQAG